MGDVRVEATQWHTCHGGAYEVGDQYDTDEQTAASLEAQGKAKRVEAPAAKTKAATVEAEAPVARTTAVTPMTTNAAPLVQPKARNRTIAAPRVTKAKAKGRKR